MREASQLCIIALIFAWSLCQPVPTSDSSESIPLALDASPRADSFNSSDQTRNYTLQVSNSPETLYLRITPCLGEVTFSLHSTPSSRGPPELSRETLHDGTMIACVRGEPGMPYLIVVSPLLRGSQGQWAYQIQVSRKEMRRKYIPEDEGRIRIGSGNAVLRWGKLLEVGGAATAPDVKYSVYSGSDQESTMKTACGIAMGKAQLVAGPMLGREAKVNLTAGMVFNVVARIPGTDVEIAYNPIEVPKEESGNVGWKILVLMAIIIAAFVANWCIGKKETEKAIEETAAVQPEESFY